MNEIEEGDPTPTIDVDPPVLKRFDVAFRTEGYAQIADEMWALLPPGQDVPNLIGLARLFPHDIPAIASVAHAIYTTADVAEAMPVPWPYDTEMSVCAWLDARATESIDPNPRPPAPEPIPDPEISESLALDVVAALPETQRRVAIAVASLHLPDEWRALYAEDRVRLDPWGGNGAETVALVPMPDGQWGVPFHVGMLRFANTAAGLYDSAQDAAYAVVAAAGEAS